MPGMLQIFGSSTFRDLKEERRKVIHVIDDLGKRFPVKWTGMEGFGAAPATPLQVSTAFAEKADLVVLLVADSYGSRPPDRDKSFTEAEFAIILRDKIPCLAYLKPSDDSRLSPEIAEFRNPIKTELTSCTYESGDDLECKVRRDLEGELQLYLDTAPLNTASFDFQPFGDYTTFVGREQELQSLQGALASGATAIGIWGLRGIGKTALAQRFFSTKRDIYDPIWLRVDDLFARYTDGRPRIGGPRWLKEDLLKSLSQMLQQRPRAVLIFDNVQAPQYRLPGSWSDWAKFRRCSCAGISEHCLSVNR
jgi:hypothetical protein